MYEGSTTRGDASHLQFRRRTVYTVHKRKCRWEAPTPAMYSTLGVLCRSSLTPP